MKTILVATDFSRHAEIAGTQARVLARRLSAKLVWVHTTVMYDAKPTAYEIAHGEIEEFRRVLQGELDRRRKSLNELVAAASAEGIPAEFRLVEGKAAEAICETAEEVGADLIVVGSHGRTGVKRFFLGSVAERVVRLAKVSVLVARAPGLDDTHEGFSRILVPTDFAPASRYALELAGSLATEDAVIDILHCFSIDGLVDGTLEPAATTVAYSAMAGAMTEDAKRRGQALVESATTGKRRVAFHIHDGRPTGAVQAFIEESDSADYDLVAVGTHGRQGVERWLLGSVAEATVRYSPCSVLVARKTD